MITKHFKEAEFHSHVANWLTMSGYTYRHEFTIAHRCRPDFIAEHQPTGIRLLIEVKPELRGGKLLAAAVDQLLSYTIVSGYTDAIPVMLTCVHHPVYSERNDLFCKMFGIVYAQLPVGSDYLDYHGYYSYLVIDEFEQYDVIGIPTNERRAIESQRRAAFWAKRLNKPLPIAA